MIEAQSLLMNATTMTLQTRSISRAESLAKRSLNHAEQHGPFARDKRRLILSPERLDERWQQG